jgi:hypothetical protein
VVIELVVITGFSVLPEFFNDSAQITAPLHA